MAEKDHSHHHHPHEHHDGVKHTHVHAHEHAGHVPLRPSRFRSLIALSGMQRLLLTLPAIAVLWMLAFWAMGWLG